ncbi:nitroreductase family protein [Herbiconiux sp. CPCC 203407]|uniref:Nitroreductase family protein n=1 Tax=Herbiconiux oxytropis TaxID=2970915 RepID=A0AA41XBY5_9MICO|nr:nitroreductase family protein [Herbiconiux oxytropis]MCS5722966.1 nitroreductase family protein [Herbiconiux oxytropis]MCS5725222.1 nitroreductase family protein [Herbiconiux oxytropis]
MSIVDIPSRTAETSTPIHSTLAERWSPRSFEAAETLDEQRLTAALEAARWAPSANNSQPARFIVARRGTPEFTTVVENLMSFNQAWADRAGALVVAVAETVGDHGAPRRWAEYDLGQAMAYFTVQAHHDGLHVHQMGGIDPAGLASAFGLPAHLVPVTVAAVGTLASPDALPDDTLRARESAPRTRLPLDTLLLPTP